MKRLRTLLACGALAAGVNALAACTYGAPGSITGASSSGGTTIDISLTAFAANTIPAGRAGGYSPSQVIVPLGTTVRFVNTDSFAHTASAVGGSTFPASSPLTASALTSSANAVRLSVGAWSSGNLAPGAASPFFVADAPGTYLFACFYHYAAPMRGAIVVR